MGLLWKNPVSSPTAHSSRAPGTAERSIGTREIRAQNDRVKRTALYVEKQKQNCCIIWNKHINATIVRAVSEHASCVTGRCHTTRRVLSRDSVNNIVSRPESCGRRLPPTVVSFCFSWKKNTFFLFCFSFNEIKWQTNKKNQPKTHVTRRNATAVYIHDKSHVRQSVRIGTQNGRFML